MWVGAVDCVSAGDEGARRQRRVSRVAAGRHQSQAARPPRWGLKDEELCVNLAQRFSGLPDERHDQDALYETVASHARKVGKQTRKLWRKRVNAQRGGLW